MGSARRWIVRNAEVGPATGFKLILDEQRALLTELADAPR